MSRPRAHKRASRAVIARTAIPLGIARIAISLAIAAPLLDCTGQDQSLGGDPPFSTMSTSPTTSATAPTSPAAIDTRCPTNRPAEGSPCAPLDDHGAPSAPQCAYDLTTSCKSVCLCGVGGGWTCFRSACGILSNDGCAESEPCSDGVGCSVGTRACRCGADGRLHCDTAL